MRAELPRDTHTHGDGAKRNLVRFLDRVVRFEEREAVVELHVKRISQSRYRACLTGEYFAFPNGFLTVLTVFTVDLLSSVLQ